MSGNGKQVPPAPNQRIPGSNGSQLGQGMSSHPMPQTQYTPQSQNSGHGGSVNQQNTNLGNPAQVARMNTTMAYQQLGNGIPTRIVQAPLNVQKGDPNVPPRYANMNCIVPHTILTPIRYPPRTPTPQRDNYHLSGTPSAYLQSGAATPVAAQATLRGMSTGPALNSQQQTELNKPQQMNAHYGMPAPAQGQTTQPRPQMQSYQYRSTSQPARPTHHTHRQQPTAIYPNSGGAAQMMLVFGPPFGFTQPYQPRQGYMPSNVPIISQPSLLGFSYPPQNPSQGYYGGNNQSLPATNITTGSQPGRANPANAVTQPGANVAINNQPSVAHQTPTPSHIHQSQGSRPSQQTQKRKSFAISIINPHTMQEVIPDAGASQVPNSAESSERQTPQPETNSIVEEFSRKIIRAAHGLSTSETQPKDLKQLYSAHQIVKFENTNNNKITNDETDNMVTVNETPIVSALIDNPQIVPKMSSTVLNNPNVVNIEQKIILDTNKNISNTPHNIMIPNKPEVPLEQRKVPEIYPIPQSEPTLPAELISEHEIHANGPPSPQIYTSVIENTPDSNIIKAQTIEDPVSQISTVNQPVTQQTEKHTQQKGYSVADESVIHKVVHTLSNVEIEKFVTTGVNDNITETSEDIEVHTTLLTTNNMKDIVEIVNTKITDVDTANGNADTNKENINYNEKSSNKSTINLDNKLNNESNETNKNNESELNANERVAESNVSGNNEPGKTTSNDNETKTEQLVKKPKYSYKEGQWSPFNQNGRKVYEREFLMELMNDPKSKIKPDVLMNMPEIVRTKPAESHFSLSNISRPNNESFLPSFAIPQQRGGGGGGGGSIMKEQRKTSQPNKLSVRGAGGSSMSLNKNVIHLSLRSEVKLNESENAWKPSRLQPAVTVQVDDQEKKSLELYKKFRSILNKLTPEKFDKLLDQVKALEIDTEEKLRKIIDLVFDKAIDEPNFSVAYAKMCKHLSLLAVPSSNNVSEVANFKKMLIAKCQEQFEIKEEKSVTALEEEVSKCTDENKKKELELLLEEEKRKVRMKSVGNVRFIGELFKLEMLTIKIMKYCLDYLVKDEVEQKLECLCKLLSTIGSQLEREEKGQIILNEAFVSMQKIVDRKSNKKISSRVRFMLQDVMELRKKKWISRLAEAPKTMDEIQKEAELHQRNIEIINSVPMNSRRDDSRSGKGGNRDNRRSVGGSSMGSMNSYDYKRIDTSKLKAGATSNKPLKLAPTKWAMADPTKNIQSTSMIAPTTHTNMYSVLENTTSDPTTLRNMKDTSPGKGASIERSTFKFSGRNNYNATPTKSSQPAQSSIRSSSEIRSEPTLQVEQLPLTDQVIKQLDYDVESHLVSPNESNFIYEMKLIEPQYHASLINHLLYKAVDKKSDHHPALANALYLLLNSGTVSSENFMKGLTEVLEDADLSLDVPLSDVYLAFFILQPIRSQMITFNQLHKATEKISPPHRRASFLAVVLKLLREDMGPSFVRSKWLESQLKLDQWMDSSEVSKFVENNKLGFLDNNVNIVVDESTMKKSSPEETQKKLTELLNSEVSIENISKWIKECVGSNVGNESWFIHVLTTCILEYALGVSNTASNKMPRLNEQRMKKYALLLACDNNENRASYEADVLLAVQRLIHRLEHPQGVTLSIFKYLSENDIISQDGFLAWESKSTEPEGQGVMLKALVAFFTDMKEGDNEEDPEETQQMN